MTTMQPVANSPANERSPAELLRLIASRALDTRTVTRNEERRLFAWCRQHEVKALGRIERHVARAAFRAARREAVLLRESLPARLAALSSTVPKHLRVPHGLDVRCHQAARTTRLRAILDNVGAVSGFHLPAHARLRVKRKRTYAASCTGLDAYRPIFSFGWADKARQRLLSTGLTPFADFHHSQYLLRRGPSGRGRSAVCEDLLNTLPRLPESFVFMQFDVRNFFATISHAWLEENLGWSRSLIRCHVHTGGMSVSTMASAKARLGNGELQELVRRGIPGGSALSPSIGEYVMADILKGLADHLVGCWPITYCDNLGIFLPGEAAEVTEEQLREAFRCHGAGPFELTATRPVAISEGFRFLGHWWRRVGDAAEVFVPPEVAEGKLLQIGAEVSVSSEAELRGLTARIRSQAAEWKYWPGVADWSLAALSVVDSARRGLQRLGASAGAAPSVEVSAESV